MHKTLVAALWDIRSLHNVGAIFRTADGAGFDKVILGGICGAPPDKRISKVSLGAEDYLDWQQTSSQEEFLFAMEGYHVVALEQGRDAVSPDKISVSWREKVILLVGNEITGLPDWLLERADQKMEIPMYGAKESLYVSVAFGIGAYALQARDPKEGLMRERSIREGVLTRGESTNWQYER